MNRRSRRTGKAQDRGLFLFAQPQHRQRSGTRHRHPAQLAPVNQAPAAGQKGQLQGLSFLQAGRTEAAARGDPGGNWHPLQLVPGEPGRHPAQLIPRSGAERRLAGAFPAQGRNTRGAAAGGSRPHRGSGRGIDGAAAGTRNRAQSSLQVPGTGSDPDGAQLVPRKTAGEGLKFALIAAEKENGRYFPRLIRFQRHRKRSFDRSGIVTKLLNAVNENEKN